MRARTLRTPARSISLCAICAGIRTCSSSEVLGVFLELELELELIQSHMTQKQMLPGEVDALG